MHRVVIVGGGFGGLSAAKALRHAPVEVTIVDRTNYHLFQPLLYQLATGVLSEGDIAPPIRDIVRKFENTQVVLGDVQHIALQDREISVDSLGRRSRIPYDSLIVAAGAGQSYFGHDEFAIHAPGMKTIDDALEIRGRILRAFEMAELEHEPDRRDAWLTFAVVGAGPTGVELAGQISELARRALKRNYRNFSPESAARIVLIDAADTVLPTFPEALQHRAHRDLGRLGVELLLSRRVTRIDATGLTIEKPNGSSDRIETRAKIWAAGVQASKLGLILAEQSDIKLEASGRIPVEPDCSLPGFPEVFVVGDMMSMDGLPGVAEVAMQSGRHAARTIQRRIGGRTDMWPLHYHDLGTMATIARFRALAYRGRVHATGFPAWIAWLMVHLAFLTGFKNRVSAIANWAIAFVGHGGRQRAISDQQVFARAQRIADHQQPARLAHQGRP